MNITLYEAQSAMVNRFAECIDEETGEIDVARESEIVATFEQKSIAYVAVYKTHDFTITSLKAQKAAIVAQLDEAIARKEKAQQALTKRLQEAMKMTGVTKIQSDDGLLQVKLEIDRDESVELDEGAVFDLSLCNDPKPPAPSKTKIKAAILAGQPVAHARIIKRDRLTIK